jgi:hypothetical protein
LYSSCVPIARPDRNIFRGKNVGRDCGFHFLSASNW